jgi:hypothetical protein
VGSQTAKLPAKTQGVDNLTNSFRPAFKPAALTQTKADMATVQAMSDELRAKTLPAVAGALKMTPAQLQAFIAQNFPAVNKGVSQLDTVLPYFSNLIAGLDAQAPNFRKADAIPTKNLPATTVPYIFLLPGLLLAGLSVLGWVLSSTAARRAVWGCGAVGLVLIVAPLVLTVPAKAQAVDNLTNAFRPVFTAQGAATTRANMDTVQNMSDELQAKMLPALAGALQMTPAQLQAFIGQNFPAVAKGVSQLNVILPRFQGLVKGIEGNVGTFKKADSIPTKGTPTTLLHWLFVLPGIALVLTAGVALFLPWWSGARAPTSRLAPAGRVAI